MPDTGILSPRLASTTRRHRRMLFNDAIEHGIRWLGGNSQSKSLEDVREAVLLALEEIANYRRWRYYTRVGRVILSPMYETGTVTYDHTGGASERLLTLASGTWPTNAERGHVQIGNSIHKIQKRLSSTTAQLDPQLNPGVDVASGTSYKWYRSTYELPPDFLSLDYVMPENGWQFGASHGTPSGMAMENRYAFNGGSPANTFTIRGDPSSYGALSLELNGYPAAGETALTLDFVYMAMPSPLLVDGLLGQDKAGTIALTSGSATVTGTSSEFDSETHQGSVLRVARNSKLPTGIEGNNRFDYEFTVESVASSTSLTVMDDDLPAATVSGRGYLISDQVDVAAYMLPAFLRGLEWQLAQNRSMSVAGKAYEQYRMALKQAASVDGTVVHQRASAGEFYSGRQRLGKYGVASPET